MQSKTSDLLIVCLIYSAFILPPVVLGSSPPLVLNVGWFLLPSLYLIARRKKNIPEILFGTVFIGLLAFSLDIFLFHNHAWEPFASSFSFRIFGVPPEEMLWFFLHIFFILVFYEHFIDDGRIGKFRITRGAVSLAVFSTMAFVCVLFGIFTFPAASRINYAYGIMGALSMIPILVYFLSNRKAFLRKLAPLLVFFFIFALVMEIRAVQYGLWSFTDMQNYIGTVTLFSALFPIEEIIFWMTLGPSVAIGYYELFADDGR
ncbi:MAG: hypothetical protein AAB916_00695 [Patescibacteria group bacterium]